MDRSLEKLFKKHNLKLIYLPINSKGYLIKRTSKPYLIIIKQGLAEDEAKKVILHEIGHCLCDQETAHNYKCNYRSHLESEHEANSYMIHEMVKAYIALGNEIKRANYIAMADYLGANDFDIKKELAKWQKKGQEKA